MEMAGLLATAAARLLVSSVGTEAVGLIVKFVVSRRAAQRADGGHSGPNQGEPSESSGSIDQQLESIAADPVATAQALALMQVATRSVAEASGGPQGVEIFKDSLPPLEELDISQDLIGAYERALALGFPWVDSESLSAAAHWCAVRDALSPEADDQLLKQDGTTLAELFEHQPAVLEIGHAS
jgi:hypothetical protein